MLDLAHPVVLLCAALLGVGLLYAVSSIQEAGLLLVPVVVGLAISVLPGEIPTIRYAMAGLTQSTTGLVVAALAAAYFISRSFA
jgi:flagellar biosynthesis protein FliQ